MVARKKAAAKPTTTTANTGITGRRDTRRGRFYDIANGQAYPSVTTVLGVLAKPALIGWAARMEKSAVLWAVGELWKELQGTIGDIALVSSDEVRKMVEDRLGATKAYQKTLREAGDIGTQVHKKIEWDINGMLLEQQRPAAFDSNVQELEFENQVYQWRNAEPGFTHPKAEESWSKYQEWKASVQMTPIASEFSLVSHVHKYAGTGDVRLRVWPPEHDALWTVVPRTTARVADGVVVLGDFKTGKSIYGEAFLQNGAYRLAEREMGVEPTSEAGIIIRLPKEENDPHFEVGVVPSLEDTIPAFLALRAAWNWWHQDEERYAAKRKAQQDAEQAAREEELDAQATA